MLSRIYRWFKGSKFWQLQFFYLGIKDKGLSLHSSLGWIGFKPTSSNSRSYLADLYTIATTGIFLWCKTARKLWSVAFFVELPKIFLNFFPVAFLMPRIPTLSFCLGLRLVKNLSGFNPCFSLLSFISSLSLSLPDLLAFLFSASQSVLFLSPSTSQSLVTFQHPFSFLGQLILMQQLVYKYAIVLDKK